MGVRSKFLIIVGPLMIAVVLFVYGVISDRFLDQFSRIESDIAEQNIDRALDAISGALENINTKMTDWAQWDDTYAFIQDHNQAYWQSNLSSDELLNGMQLQIMAFVDRSGTVIASKNILDNDGNSDALPPNLADKILSDTFLNYDDGATFHKGIVYVDNMVFLVASRPVVRTDGTGPVIGTLIFARILDENLIDDISNRTHLPLRIYTSLQELSLSDVQKSDLFNDRKEGQDDVISIEGNTVAGYGVIHNSIEKYELIARIEMPRTIYNYGQTTTHFFSIFFGATFAIFSIVFMALLEWLVFAPISRLSADADRVRSSDDKKLRISVHGNDQFSHLSEAINQMIDSLYAMRQQKEESESRFQTMADLAPVLIWMAGVDKKCTYFNKGWLDFTGRTLDEEMGDGWAKGVHSDDLERCIQVYHTAFDARESFRMEYRLKRADGKYRWILDHGIPNFASDGMFLGYLGSCVDITDRKDAEEKNNERVREIETLNKMMVSRELKMIELKEELQRLKNK